MTLSQALNAETVVDKTGFAWTKDLVCITTK